MAKCVILLSDKSSGSTILQKELLKHPHIKAVDYTMHNDHETLFWLKAAQALNFPKSEFFENKLPFKKSYSKMSIMKLAKKNDIYLNNSFIDSDYIYDVWAKFIEKYSPVFFEKSPHHLNHWGSTSLIIDFALKHPNEVKIIGLVRNPLAVAYSAMKRWTSDPDTRQYKWAYSYRNLMEAELLIPKESYCRISYENMIIKPVDTFKYLCDFIGVEYMSSIGSDIHSKSGEKFVHDEKFYPIIQQSVRMIGEYFGYQFQSTQIKGISSYKIERLARFKFVLKSKILPFVKYFKKVFTSND